MKTCNENTCVRPVFSNGFCRYHQGKRTDEKYLSRAMKKEKVKKKEESIARLMAKAQMVFNAYIRQRDSQDGYFTCISCGRTHPVAQMDAGHYVPVKRGSIFRFSELNVHGECKGCNGFDEFHLIGYRKNLIGKIGEDAVKYLEDHRHDVKKWTRIELLELINLYGNIKKTNKIA